MATLNKDGRIDFGAQNAGLVNAWQVASGCSFYPDGGIDTSAAAGLSIGTTNANAITLGAAAVAPAFPGGLTVGAGKAVDCTSAGALSLGATTATSVTVGKAGVANGTGVRNGASRVILGNKPTAAVDATGSITATVTQVLEGAIFTAATAVNVTLPTAQGATGLVQALPGIPAVGDLIELQICANHPTNAITLVAGTGSTIFGVATITNGSRIWRGRITAVTAASETITWY